MSYTKSVEKYESDKGTTAAKRTDYRCKASGCPNSGSIDDLCYYHWQERDNAPKWPAITSMIQNDFDRCRNWGSISPERQAMHRDAAQKLLESLK